MPSCVPRVFRLFLVLSALVACAERQSPFEPIPVPRSTSNLVMPPSVSGLLLPITNEWDPSYSIGLPEYAEALIAEFTVSGIVAMPSAHADRASLSANATGVNGSDANSGCFVNVLFKYGGYPAFGFGACQSTVKSPDTVWVKGPGTVFRGPRRPQWTGDCPGATYCWRYDGSQTVSVTPLFAAINLTTPGRAEVAPSTIEVPPWTWVTFKVSSIPLGFKSIPVPIRVVSWQWQAASGGAGQPQWNFADTTLPERRARITESGSMLVTAFVNGVKQVDTVIVSVPRVKITPQTLTMRPSTLTQVVKDTSKQTITASVLGIAGALPYMSINLTLSAFEGTAGHAHTGSKPKGKFLPSGATTLTLNTGSAGVATVTYMAPDPSGPVKLTGASPTYAATSDSVEIQVKYGGLVELNPGEAYLLTGDLPPHPRNHFGTPEHIARLKTLADFFFAKFAARPTFNDTSLELGGLYDVGTTPWTDPHKGHRSGRHTDLRTIDRTETQRTALWIAWERLGGSVWDETKKKDGTPNTQNPHYHLIF